MMKTDPNHRQWVLDALDQYEGRLLRYAQRLLGGLDDAHDVVQFVFLRLCDQTEHEINDRLAPWLYTVCRNRAMDVLRASGREKVNGKSVGWDKAVSAADGPPSLLKGKSSNGKSVGRRDFRSLVPPYSKEDDPADSAEQAELHGLL